jgi:preprotein translocase subunit SecE
MTRHQRTETVGACVIVAIFILAFATGFLAMMAYLFYNLLTA